MVLWQNDYLGDEMTTLVTKWMPGVPKCDTNIKISPFIKLFLESKFEVRFFLGANVYEIVQNFPQSPLDGSVMKKENTGCNTQVWHLFPDISFWLNLSLESKFEVCFVLGAKVYEIVQNFPQLPLDGSVMKKKNR